MMRWPTGFAGNDDAARLWSFQQARESAEKVAHQLRGLFEQAYGKPDAATDVAPDACEAVADTSITLADLRRVDQWRLEYIRLGDDDHGDFLPVGETPA
ncbi:hypothetical protein [Verminephrobacter eiseniae]|uniref:hypothetical protein n=1 Tax=Verminephrobacter eiseniae TaxID=364317 RepID=UPI0022378972|nr:hypothetical protein [Verminephrobacter eiseniae]